MFRAFVCFFGLTRRCKKSSLGCLEYLRNKGTDSSATSEHLCVQVLCSADGGFAEQQQTVASFAK